MPDLYAELIPLTQELQRVDGEIEEVTAPLRTKRAEIQRKIDEVAARILGLQNPGSGAVKNPSTERSLEPPDLRGPVHVPPRRLKLLRAMAASPDAGYPELTLEMYHRDDRAARSSLSAEFSELKKLGVIETVDKGKFRLTALGAQVLREEARAS